MSYRDDLQAAVERADKAEREVTRMREGENKNTVEKMAKPPRKPWRWPRWLTVDNIIVAMFVSICLGLVIYVFVMSERHSEQRARQMVLDIPVVEKMSRDWAEDLGYKVVKVRCTVDRDCALHVENLAAPISLHCGETVCTLK